MYSNNYGYVVFKKAKNLGWMQRFLHPEISHCFYMFNDRGVWVVCDHSLLRTEIFTVAETSDILQDCLVVKVKCKDVGVRMRLGSCVGMVKRLIGLDDPFILTPYQLLKRIRHGI